MNVSASLATADDREILMYGKLLYKLESVLTESATVRQAAVYAVRLLQKTVS